MEEIDDVDDMPNDPFVAEAIANEGDLNLTEEQKRNFRKVSFVSKQIFFLPKSFELVPIIVKSFSSIYLSWESLMSLRVNLQVRSFVCMFKELFVSYVNQSFWYLFLQFPRHQLRASQGYNFGLNVSHEALPSISH